MVLEGCGLKDIREWGGLNEARNLDKPLSCPLPTSVGTQILFIQTESAPSRTLASTPPPNS